jgi:hypothetical protein
MPIRTNRGRAAVYRRLWGWPLRSPRHLIVGAVGLVVVAIAVAVVTARAGGSGGHRTTGNGNVAITSEVPTPVSALGGQGGPTTGTGTANTPVTTLATAPTPMSAPPSPAALAVIDAWGKAWVNHPVGMTNAQWLAQLKPYTTAEFLPVMSSVDVANINATEVTGAPKATKSYVSSLEALLPTNAGQLDITAIDTPQGWQVSSYTEAS